MKNENTVEKVLEIKVRYDDAIRNIAKYRAAIDDLKKEEAEYKKALKDKKISQEEYNAKLVETEKKMMHAKDVVQTLTKDVRNNIKIEKEQTGSLKQLRAQLSNLTSEYDSLSEVERKASRGQELKIKINGITDSLKEAEGETQRFYRSVGSYEEAIKNALGMNNSFADSLLRMADNAKSGSGLFSNLKTEASAFGNTLTSLLKNKVFLGIAGIAGAGVVFKWWYDYNKGLVEATKLTRQFTDKSGDDLKAYRSEVQALAVPTAAELSGSSFNLSETSCITSKVVIDPLCNSFCIFFEFSPIPSNAAAVESVISRSRIFASLIVSIPLSENIPCLLVSAMMATN